MKSEKKMRKKTTLLGRERGSLALEQVLFIAAIVTFSFGIFGFYEDIAEYFGKLDISELPSAVSTSGVPGGGSS